jgi:hypothetical protein
MRLIAMLGCACLAGCGGAAPHAASTSSSITSATTSVATQPAPAVRTRPARASRPADPCPPRAAAALPQTARVPSAKSACFRAIVRAVWQAVRSGSTRGAAYAFFPLRAYEQVKAIADPRGDYVGRLRADYLLDLHAAHALLGANAPAARLVRAIVPTRGVHWVPPGACYNRLGYYEVANSRLVYRVGGQVRSFGIASLISWRGTWYVVHLGAVTRAGYGGVVDAPSDGPGTPEPSLSC